MRPEIKRVKECPRCGKMLHPLGYARHMAMHRDGDRLLDRYKTKPDTKNPTADCGHFKGCECWKTY